MPYEPWAGTMGLLKRFGGDGPITRERFLNLYYAGNPPTELTPEQEMDLPPELRITPKGRAAKLED